jgi:hypothetical protein
MPLSLPWEFYHPEAEPVDPGNVVEITNVTEQGLSRLVPEYQETPRWQAWIASTLDTLQELESAAFDLWIGVLNLDEAVGSQLDLLGRIVREDRDGRDDDTYRLALRVRVLVNRSNGKIEELIRIIRLFEDLDSEPAAYVRITEHQPARMEIRIVATLTNTYAAIRKRVLQAKAGGVAVQILFAPAAAAFRFGRAADYPEGSADEGFTNTAADVAGGALAHVLD